MCCLSHTLTQAVQASSGMTNTLSVAVYTECHSNWSHSHAKRDATVSMRVSVTSLPAPLTIKGSARNQQDVRWSPIRAGHAKNRPIAITGRSIGASLI